MSAPLPIDEAQRLAKLLSYDILDTEHETAYDDITRLAAQLCEVPIALVSLIDHDRQWFKSAEGLNGVCQTDRDSAFCAHAILHTDIMVIPDATQDPRFADNPFVVGAPYIRFYAGAPLTTPDGFAMGTLCVIDTQPRTLSEPQQQALASLSRLVVNQLELRQKIDQLTQAVTEREAAETTLKLREQGFEQLTSKAPGMLFQFRLTPEGHTSFPYVSDRCQEIYGGLTQAEIRADASNITKLIIPNYLASFQQAVMGSAQSLQTFDWTGPIIDLQGREKWLQIQSTPELEADNSILWHGVLMDVTEQRQLQRERDRLLAMLEATPDIVVMTDAQGRSLYLNKAGQETLAIPAERLTSFHITQIMPRAFAKTFESEVVPAAIRDGCWSGEGRILNRYGDEIPVSQALVAHKNEQGTTEFFSTILRDIRDRKQAEAQLQESYNLLNGVINGNQDLIFVKTLAGRYTLVNQAFAESFGQSSAALMGKTDHYIFPSDIADQIQADDQQVMESGQMISYEETVVIQGETRTFMTNKAPYRDANNNIQGILGSARDITQRKQIEEKITASKQFLQFILDALPQGVIWKDQDLRIQGCNQQIANMLGFASPKELIGKTDYDLPFPRAEADWYRSCDRRVITSQQAELGIIEPQTIGNQTTWLNTNKLPLKNYSGAIEGILITIEDITQLKQAQQQLKEQADLERLLNQINAQLRKTLDFETILSTTLENLRAYLKVDRCTFTWHYTDEAVPYWLVLGDAHHHSLPSLAGLKTPASTLGPINHQLLNLQGDRVTDAANLPKSPLQAILEPFGTRAFLSVPFQRASGQVGVLNCSNYSGPRVWQDQEVEILKDVLEQLDIALTQAELYDQSQTRAQELQHALQTLQRTQAQMVQTEKMSSLGQLVAGVAHEINNPIGFIYTNLIHAQTYTQDLLGLVDLYETHRSILPAPVNAQITNQIEDIDLEFLRADLPHLFGSMKNGANRVKTIVESLRTFSRLDEAAFKDIDIHQSLESTLTILENRLRENNTRKAISVVKIYDQLPKVECYAGQLNQVLINILNNAIDALENSPQSIPEIRIQTRLLNDKTIEIAIADNGPGISANELDRIFDPFFTTKPVGKGTGMGLSTSYQIITDTHNGSLVCESILGQGSNFIIQLPVRLNRSPSSDSHTNSGHTANVRFAQTNEF